MVTSEPAFFGGFLWHLRYDLGAAAPGGRGQGGARAWRTALTPAPSPARPDASQPPEYREHMGLACHARLAGRKFNLPCVKVGGGEGQGEEGRGRVEGAAAPGATESSWPPHTARVHR